MNKQILAGGAVAGLLLAGGIGVALTQTADAATSVPTPSSSSSTATTKVHSNTDPAHEAGESADRKAQEAKDDAAAPSSTNG